MCGLLMSQLLHEGGESSGSGAEHAVAVQRTEEPLQTGRNLKNIFAVFKRRAQTVDDDVSSPFSPLKSSASSCRTAGATPTLSPPSPHWSKTATFPSRHCPPVRCRHLPSLYQVRDRLTVVKLQEQQRKDFSNFLENVLYFSSQAVVRHPRQRCSESEDTVQTIRKRNHLCNSTRITETTVYSSSSTQVREDQLWLWHPPGIHVRTSAVSLCSV